MAKSQVTEQDLEQSLQTLGGFGKLATQKPRRDSPFGSEFSRKPEESKPIPQVAPPETSREVTLLSKAPGEGIEGLEEDDEVVLTNVLPKSSPTRRGSKPLLEETTARHPKCDTLTERVTVQMSPEMRDAVSDLARHLQRRRKDKGERITANSVMRVAIQYFLDNVQLERVQGASTELEIAKSLAAGMKTPGRR
jgi:hypothetical protein